MITVSDKARDYIRQKGGYVHVLHSFDTVQCWVPVNFGPSVRLGKPPHDAGYILAMMNGVNVYVPMGFHTPNALTIGLGEIFWLKILRIEGWKLI